MRKIIISGILILCLSFSAHAIAENTNNIDNESASAVGVVKKEKREHTPLTDTNLQLLYDFGNDRKAVTVTFEMFHGDAWGNTFFFVDVDMNFKNADGRNVGPSGAYAEISRSLNFWQNSLMKDFSLQVEYNGGLGALSGGYPIKHAFLAGANYCLHTPDFRYTLTLEVLFKKYIDMAQKVPMQFTAVWGCRDLFGAKGLNFSGFADVWQEGWVDKQAWVFITEPQLWYSVGQWFNCPNLNIGGEVEMSYNFAAEFNSDNRHFRCRPCLGLKWVF